MNGSVKFSESSVNTGLSHSRRPRILARIRPRRQRVLHGIISIGRGAIPTGVSLSLLALDAILPGHSTRRSVGKHGARPFARRCRCTRLPSSCRLPSAAARLRLRSCLSRHPSFATPSSGKRRASVVCHGRLARVSRVAGNRLNESTGPIHAE